MVKRNTIQRQLIVNAIHELHKHPTVDDIYSYIAEKYPGISKGTVYRNINLLVEEGLLIRLISPGVADRFDSGVHKHYHIYCRGCGSLTDAPIRYYNELDKALADATDFQIDNHHIVFNGLCPECRKK